MFLKSGLVFLFTVACVWTASAGELVDMGARVTKVDTRKPRATIDKGKKAGLKVGDSGPLYPMRKEDGATSASVDFNVRIAVGKVVEIKDDSAVLALDAVTDPVQTGAYFAYELEVSDELARSALFRVTALGIEVRPQWEDKLYLTTEAMLADPSAALRDTTLDKMIADVKAMKATVQEHLKGRIEEGRHHGKSAGKVVDELDRAQLLDFFLFVESYPGKYIGNRWKLPEIYFTWVINGTPSGERDRKLKQAKKTIVAARKAATAGKLDEARALWQSVLASVPDHKDAATTVAKIDKILLLRRAVTEDPDDTASRFTLANELYELGAYDLAIKDTEPLTNAKYEPFKVDRLRGYILVRQDKWKEAEVVFKRLVKDKPDDKNLPGWLQFIRAQARLQKAPNDPDAHMQLADVNFASKSWDNALVEYRKVLSSKTATAKQREIAKAGQERIAIQKELDQRVTWARNDITKHDVARARERIEQAMRLLEKLKDAKQASTILDDLANLARSSTEQELALELLDKRVERVPDDRTAHTALAWALLGFERIDDAEKAAKKSLGLKGDPAYAYQILSHVARARDDLADAEKQANLALKADAKYGWPMVTLARVQAANGDWGDALEIAKKALELLPDEYDARLTHTACARGLQAHEALQANPKSPRERLRLARAYGELGLSKKVAEEIAKLPADGTWRSEAWWTLAASGDYRLQLKDRLAAARNAKPTTEVRKRKLAQLEGEMRLRTNPKDEATRIELARLYIKAEDFDRGLAILVPLMAGTMKPAVGDLVRDAREAIQHIDPLAHARAAVTRRDFATATRLALAAQAVHDRIGTQYGRISTREIRSDVLAEQGKYPEAMQVVEEAKQLAAADGDATMLSLLERRLAQLKANIGTNDALHKALLDGHKLCDDLDDDYCLYWIYSALTSIEQDNGRSTEALDNARKAWNTAERLGRADLARRARFEMADANLTGSRFGDAEQLALKLLVDSRKHDDVENEQYSLMVLGAVAMMRGQGKLARGRFQEVYELGARTGQTAWRALARKFEGNAWLKADHDPAKAAVALEQAAELYESLGEGWAVAQRGSALHLLADARLQAGKLAPARQAAEQAFALAQRYQRRTSVGTAQWILAMVAIKESKGDEALKAAKAAVAIAQKTDDASLLWNAYHALARASELKALDKDAVDAYEKALEHLGRALLASGGESEQQGYMNTGRVREVYKDAIARMLKSGNTKRAMEILELSRDAQLKQAFDPTKVATKDPKLRARLDKYEESRNRVQGLQKQLDKAMEKPGSEAQVKAISERIAKTRQEMNQVVLDLKVTHRHLFQALAMDPQNLVGRRADLPKDSVLVQYFVASDALYAFVIAAALAQPAVVRVKVSSADLEKLIDEYRDALMTEQEKVKERAKVEELGRKLDDVLIEPLRAHLDGASTVIILPFGPLYYVPFDGLVVSEPGQPVRYALEDFRISIQTATTLEHLLRPVRARPTGTMLAISNPDGTLPGAQREVSRIVKTALPDAQVLGQKQATVKKVLEMAGAFRYLHIATHGILDADPRKSHLKLSDGVLTVEQIAQLQGLEQGNELVVLSACDTAMEQGESTGDELVSLAVGFSMAGSPALVASLWEVADDSTAELMATFYRALEKGSGGDRLDALRNAKLNLLRMERNKERPFASPWHWASFQLYGDYRAAKQ